MEAAVRPKLFPPLVLTQHPVEIHQSGEGPFVEYSHRILAACDRAQTIVHMLKKVDESRSGPLALSVVRRQGTTASYRAVAVHPLQAAGEEHCSQADLPIPHIFFSGSRDIGSWLECVDNWVADLPLGTPWGASPPPPSL